uniref:RING-type domain-containing protein n=1 Tax=Steinernema glaseri TaxID=37863 RepID=A0A1I7YFE7_9BILA
MSSMYDTINIFNALATTFAREYINVNLAEVTDDEDFDNVQTPRMTLGYDWRTANTEVVQPRQRRARRGRTVAATTESRTSVARRDSAEIQGPLTRSRKRQMERAKPSISSSTTPEEPQPPKKVRAADPLCPPVAELTVEDKLKEKEQELQEAKDRLESCQRSTEKTLSCAICMGILHRPMDLSPCAHKFCSSCMSTLLKEKLTSTHPCHSCPQCRMEMYALTKDASTSEHVENYYATFPEQKPDPKELEKRDKGDKILAICRQSNGTIVLPPQIRGRSKLPLRAP